jgi:hypothetical protein
MAHFTRVLLCSRVFVQSLERMLYIWAIRHPASGYVQGINDLATPFVIVFATSVIGMCTLML